MDHLIADAATEEVALRRRLAAAFTAIKQHLAAHVPLGSAPDAAQVAAVAANLDAIAEIVAEAQQLSGALATPAWSDQ